MPERIAVFLATKPAPECARLLGNVRHYIHNDQLINLLQNFDVNNMNANVRLSSQFVSFEGIPGLHAQVTTWMNSRVV